MSLIEKKPKASWKCQKDEKSKKEKVAESLMSFYEKICDSDDSIRKKRRKRKEKKLERKKERKRVITKKSR